MEQRNGARGESELQGRGQGIRDKVWVVVRLVVEEGLGSAAALPCLAASRSGSGEQGGSEGGGVLASNGGISHCCGTHDSHCRPQPRGGGVEAYRHVQSVDVDSGYGIEAEDVRWRVRGKPERKEQQIGQTSTSLAWSPSRDCPSESTPLSPPYTTPSSLRPCGVARSIN